MKQILFVCTGNTCRSPMAEMYFNHTSAIEKINVFAESAGIMAVENNKMSELAKQVLKENGIEIDNNFRSKQVNLVDIKNSDIILCMEKSHKEYIIGNYDIAKDKVYTLNEYAGIGDIDINDPIGLDINKYKETFKEIKRAIDIIIKKEKV